MTQNKTGGKSIIKPWTIIGSLILIAMLVISAYLYWSLILEAK